MKKCVLGDVAICHDNRRVPLSAAQRADRKGPYRYYGAQVVIDHIDDYLFDGEYLLIAEDGENLRSQKQNIANLAIGKFWVNNHAHIIQTNDACDLRYLKYLLNLTDISGYVTGSAQPKLSQESMMGIRLSLPDIVEQRKISAVLSAIEDKIALNRKRIATLEAMAKEIYDYWFVQFDFPDAHGRPYKSSGGAMVYNPDLKREIPKGWEVKPLGELTRIILGGTPSTEESRYWDGGTVPWLSSGEVANFPVLTSEKKITELAIKHSATDLMPSGSVALSITRYIRPTILAIEACANQSVVGVLETEQLHNSLIYPYLVSQVPRFLGLRTGAQQPHINKDTVSVSMLPVAVQPVLKWYYDLVDPVYNDIIVVARNLQEMYKLRDFLLPLLMNGQVKVA